MVLSSWNTLAIEADMTTYQLASSVHMRHGEVQLQGMGPILISLGNGIPREGKIGSQIIAVEWIINAMSINKSHSSAEEVSTVLSSELLSWCKLLGPTLSRAHFWEMELRDCDCIRITHTVRKTDVGEAQLSALRILSKEIGIVTEPETAHLAHHLHFSQLFQIYTFFFPVCTKVCWSFQQWNRS